MTFTDYVAAFIGGATLALYGALSATNALALVAGIAVVIFSIIGSIRRVA